MSGCFIASVGNSNNGTPAMPREDRRNPRLPSILVSLDGLVIMASVAGKQCRSRLLYSCVESLSIYQHSGVKNPLRIELTFSGSHSVSEHLGTLAIVLRTVHTANGVMMS